VLLVGLLLTATATLHMKSSVEKTVGDRFFAQCNKIQNEIAERLDDHARILLSGAAFFNASDSVSRHEWRTYTQYRQFKYQLPGIQGLGFSLLIPAEELPQHILDIRREGFPSYQVSPEGKRQVYSAIIYLEPFSNRNRRAFGYDMFSEPVRRDAMERARDTNMPALSGKVALIQETGDEVQAGNLMYVPVYRKGMPVLTVEQRRAAIYGWVYSPYRMRDLMQGILGNRYENENRPLLQIFDGDEASLQSLLYEDLPDGDAKFSWGEARSLQQIPIDFNGHRWMVHFAQAGAWYSSVDYLRVWLTLAGGMLITLLMFALIRSLHNTSLEEQRIMRMFRQSDKSLRRSEERLALALQLGNAGSWGYNIETGKFWNSVEGARIYGLLPACGNTTLEVMEACIPEWERVHQALVALINEGQEYNLQYAINPADGSPAKFITSIARLERDQQGHPLEVLGFVQDITERKKAEEQLANEKYLQQMLLDNFPGVVLLLRVQTREVVVSNRAGINVGAVCGSTCFKTWGQSQSPCTWCLAQDMWTTGKEQSTVIEVGEKVFEGHWVPVTDDLFLHYSFDITERKRAEEKLLENEHVIQQALIISNSFAFDWNTVTDQVHRSASCKKIFGIDYEKMVNATSRDYSQHVHPDDRLRLEHLLLNLLPTADTYTTDYRLMLSDGTVVSLDETAQAYFDDTGKTTRIIGVSSDITKRKLAEEERTELERQLHQSQKIDSVGRLAGGVAHDYNNMLSVIIGRTELAQMRSHKPEFLHNDLDQILQAAMRSRDITQQLLAFARKQIIAPRILDLNETVESMLTMLKQLLGENIDLVWQPKEGLWPVEMDPSQMDQILANLCINARDSIADIGKMTIETRMVTLDQAYCHDHAGFIPGDFVMLAVSDDGCGMDKETLDKIFEPFFTTKPTGKGTGLGLSMVYGVVKQSNGFINVYSEPNEGTTFKIYLPRHTGQIAEECEAVCGELLKGQGETVLVVEDETSILTLIEEMLSDFGYKVLAASSPSEAVDLANAHPGEIQLLITDVVMPKMNGRVLAGRLLQNHPQLKCLYMSGYTADVIAHHGVLDKGIHFIQKPFSRIDFSVHIRTALGLNA
jgi:PAS domain S-box-containing protein